MRRCAGLPQPPGGDSCGDPRRRSSRDREGAPRCATPARRPRLERVCGALVRDGHGWAEGALARPVEGARWAANVPGRLRGIGARPTAVRPEMEADLRWRVTGLSPRAPRGAGANVMLIEPADEEVFEGAAQRDGVWFAAPSQVAADTMTRQVRRSETSRRRSRRRFATGGSIAAACSTWPPGTARGPRRRLVKRGLGTSS